MVMKVRKCEPYLVDGFDVSMMHRALMHYTDSLEKFKQWMEEESREKLNGIENIEEEIMAYRKFSMDVYMKCFKKNINLPEERIREYKE